MKVVSKVCTRISGNRRLSKSNRLDNLQGDESIFLKWISEKDVFVLVLYLPYYELSCYFVHPCFQHCNPETHFMRLISLITTVMFTEPYYFHTYLFVISGRHKDKFTLRRGRVLSRCTHLWEWKRILRNLAQTEQLVQSCSHTSSTLIPLKNRSG
jgi:hypothetical protein